jgi:hypothetical protein
VSPRHRRCPNKANQALSTGTEVVINDTSFWASFDSLERKGPLPGHLFSQGHVQQRSQRVAMVSGLCYDGGASLLDRSGVVALGAPVCR